MRQKSRVREESNNGSNLRAKVLAEGRQTLYGKVLCFVERLERLGPKARENALIIIGHKPTEKKKGEWQYTFQGLLADAKMYPAYVTGHYDPRTELVTKFSIYEPSKDSGTKSVRFEIDFDGKAGYEVISGVEFKDGQNNPHLRALVGMPISILPETLLGK